MTNQQDLAPGMVVADPSWRILFQLITESRAADLLRHLQESPYFNIMEV